MKNVKTYYLYLHGQHKTSLLPEMSHNIITYLMYKCFYIYIARNIKKCLFFRFNFTVTMTTFTVIWAKRNREATASWESASWYRLDALHLLFHTINMIMKFGIGFTHNYNYLSVSGCNLSLRSSDIFSVEILYN